MLGLWCPRASWTHFPVDTEESWQLWEGVCFRSGVGGLEQQTSEIKTQTRSQEQINESSWNWWRWKERLGGQGQPTASPIHPTFLPLQSLSRHSRKSRATEVWGRTSLGSLQAGMRRGSGSLKIANWSCLLKTIGGTTCSWPIFYLSCSYSNQRWLGSWRSR